MTTALLRKEKSIEILKSHNIPYIEHLPVIETSDNIKIRSKEEIAKRALACLLSVQVACDIQNGGNVKKSKEFFTTLLRNYGVQNELTEKEKAIFNGNPSEMDVINMIWKYEEIWVLLWTLGIIDKLDYPSHYCDCKLIVNTISKCRNFNDFIKLCKLRDIEEILDEADLIFRYDWACVDARIKNQEAPAKLDAGVVFERHCVMNWILDLDGTNDWDNSSANT